MLPVLWLGHSRLLALDFTKNVSNLSSQAPRHNFCSSFTAVSLRRTLGPALRAAEISLKFEKTLFREKQGPKKGNTPVFEVVLVSLCHVPNRLASILEAARARFSEKCDKFELTTAAPQFLLQFYPSVTSGDTGASPARGSNSVKV